MRTQQASAPLGKPELSLPRPGWTRALVFLYFLSGFTAIAYEVLWVRMLGLQFGVSIFGVIVTVAAFMAGLGGGSLLGVNLGANLKRPLLVFAGLEGVVALYALAMPSMLQWMDGKLAQIAAQSSLSQWHFIQSVSAFLVLCLPALAMGTGFPLILRALARTSAGVSKLYGINTLGGALGALFPLVFLPAWGWASTLYTVVGSGLTIAAIVALLSFKLITPAASGAVREAGLRVNLPWRDMLLYAGIGAAALILEVGWTRLYGMIFLRTEYVLAVILCSFLIGIGSGSLLARVCHKGYWLKVLPIVAASFVLLGQWLFPLVAGWADNHQDFSSLSSVLFWQGLVITGITLPVTLSLGAWLPLLSKRMQQGEHTSGAWLYGANSLGAASGALVGGFLLIPWLGTNGALILAALLLCICGLLLVRMPRALVMVPLLLLAAWPVMSMPPVAKLLPVTQGATHDLALYEDALSITHVVEQANGQRVLLADLRRMDASSDSTAIAVQQNQARLALLLHPSPHTVLFLGLGTGISAAGALSFPDIDITAVEVSQGAISAAEDWFVPVNAGIMDKMTVIRDDARRFLRADSKHYDVIVGDLFHPDLVGRGNLLSMQQFRRAKERLADDGIFVQWLALNQFDLYSLRTVLRSFKEIFPQAQLFLDGFRLAMVGPKRDWLGAQGMIQSAAAMSAAQLQQATGGEGIWTWLGRYWGPIIEGAGPVEDEWRPKIEFILPRARYGGGVDLAVLLDYLLRTRSPLDEAALQLGLGQDQVNAFGRAFMAVEFAVRSWQAVLQEPGQVPEAQRLQEMAYQANPDDRWIGFTLADQMLASLPQAAVSDKERRDALRAILTIRPDHVEALKALWQLESRSGNIEKAAYYRARVLELSPLERMMK